ncbi:MAG: MBL fold metallo-hydrolase [Bacteroidales bacterium]|nr:MBL fold metallo-hydrolase [Bacteroidales bacterium]
MKLFRFAALALLVVACGPKNVVLDPEVEVGPYTVSNISPGIYHLQDYNTSNPAGEEFDDDGNKTHFNNCSDMYLLIGNTDALLVDLSNRIRWADNADESLRSIVAERIGDKPLTITFTHNHGDHTGMLPAYVNDPDVQFALPRKDFENLVSRFPGVRYEMYDDGKKFDLGGLSLTAVEVPGHTAGSMVFFVDGRDILLSGDAIGSGHGVWLFDIQAFRNYVAGFNNLIDYITDPVNKINAKALKIYGGHYWQKDWFPELGDDVFGIRYIEDMEELIQQVIYGTAVTEPSNLDHRTIDTYFRNGQAIIAWNAAFADQLREEDKHPLK